MWKTFSAWRAVSKVKRKRNVLWQCMLYELQVLPQPVFAEYGISKKQWWKLMISVTKILFNSKVNIYDKWLQMISRLYSPRMFSVPQSRSACQLFANMGATELFMRIFTCDSESVYCKDVWNSSGALLLYIRELWEGSGCDVMYDKWCWTSVWPGA